jgi:beta-1,4-N-acetylglucosaminyltransferase
MKICLVCSPGGHLTEMLELSEAFRGHDVFYITYESERTSALVRAYRFPNFTKDRLSLLTFVLRAFKILLKERPRVIVSTGAELAIPIFYLAKSLGVKRAFVGNCCRFVGLSLASCFVCPVADIFLVQWPSLLGRYGSRARYRGSLL